MIQPLYTPWLPDCVPINQDNDMAVFVGGGSGQAGPAGPKGDPGPAGPQGEDGVSVENAWVANPNGHLFISLTDGRVINAGEVKGEQGEQGEKGDQGETGAQGIQGEPGPAGPAGDPGYCAGCRNNTTLVGSTYQSTDDDFYIGVDSTEPTTVYLPQSPVDGKIIIIKAEMMPPLGNRKITIKCPNGALIDNYSEYVIQTSNASVTMIYRVHGWHIIAT